jgi:MFS superfamily sulfate permease-like transporter
VTGIVGGLVAGALPGSSLQGERPGRRADRPRVRGGAGWKLLSPRDVGRLWRTERGEAIVLIGTAPAIVATNLFEGVLIGILLAVARTAWDVSEINVDVREGGEGPIEIRLTGNATFLRLPRLLDTLEAIPHGRPVELDLSGLRHLDHACRTALLAWAARHGGRPGTSVRVSTSVVP